MNKRGIVLIVSFMVIVILTILSAAVVSRSISESRIAQRYTESTQAFWIAEAGVNRALNELRSDYAANGTCLWPTNFGQGRYCTDVSVNGQKRIVSAHGFIPSSGSARIERVIEAVMDKNIPPNFYDNVIYSSGEVDFNGNAYSVTGNVRYAEEIENTGNVNGDITYDSSIIPLARLDFQQLLAISQTQGNVYDAARLQNIQRGSDSFPGSFWYSEGVPNVVYVEADLELRGNIGTIGGFFVVVGDVITNPDTTYDATINGNGQIDGAIYTRGEFRVNGGGGNLNVNGGVWAGEETELNGNASISYSQEYMSAIQNLNILGTVQVVSWRDTQNPYLLSQ